MDAQPVYFGADAGLVALDAGFYPLGLEGVSQIQACDIFDGQRYGLNRAGPDHGWFLQTGTESPQWRVRFRKSAMGDTRVTSSGGTSALKTCFISAPAGARLGVLRASLESRGLRVLVPHDLAVGSDWASEMQKQLSQAGLVTGVLTSKRQSQG